MHCQMLKLVHACVRYMIIFFARFGLPCQLHSDLGTNFESKLFKEVRTLVGTNKSHSSSFSAKCDGQTECQNRSLLHMLKATAQEEPGCWPQRLPTLMAAYHMATRKTNGMTTNMAVLGREVMLPASLIARPPEEPLEPKVPFVHNFRETLRDAHSRVRDATHSTAKTQKSYYDKRSKCLQFKQGQLVWLYWLKPFVRQRFRKLSQLWTGSWRIEYFKSPVVCQIISTAGRKVQQTVNVNRLTPCLSPERELSTDSTSDTAAADNNVIDDDSQHTQAHTGLDFQESQECLPLWCSGLNH